MWFYQIMFAFPWNKVKTIIVLYKYEVANHVGKKNLRFPEIIFFIMAILFSLQIGVFKADKLYSNSYKIFSRQQYTDNIGTTGMRKLPNFPGKMSL